MTATRRPVNFGNGVNDNTEQTNVSSCQMNHGPYGEDAKRFPRTFTKTCMMESTIQRQMRHGHNQDGQI
jgi:hypothetical protein